MDSVIIPTLIIFIVSLFGFWYIVGNFIAAL